MPEKDGSEDKKSTKSVVNKKQKQFMNQEEQLDLSSVAESFGGKIVGEPVELDEGFPLAAAAPYLIGAGIIGTGAVGYDSYQKMRGKPGILPDLSGVVKGVYDKIRGVHRSQTIDPDVDKTFSDRLKKNRNIKKRYGTRDGIESGTFKYDKSQKNNNNKNKNKNLLKTLKNTTIAGTIGTLIGTQTKGKGKGFRMGGLPGTAHNVGRRVNPQ